MSPAVTADGAQASLGEGRAAREEQVIDRITAIAQTPTRG